MKGTFETTLITALGKEAPEDLLGRILDRIAYAERRAARVRLVIFASFSFMFVSALVPAFLYMLAEFERSAFYTYLSLLFSDAGILAGSWQDFAFTLFESAPIIGIALVLGFSSGFLWALRAAVRNAWIGYYGEAHGLKTI